MDTPTPPAIRTDPRKPTLADLLVLVAGIALVLAWFDLDLVRKTSRTAYGLEHLSMTESAGALLLAAGSCVALLIGCRRLQYGGMPHPVEWALLGVLLAEVSRRARTGIDAGVDPPAYAGVWLLTAVISGAVAAMLFVAKRSPATARPQALRFVRPLTGLASVALLAVGVVWDQVGKPILGLFTVGCFIALVCLRKPKATPEPARALVGVFLLLVILNNPFAVLHDRSASPIVVGTSTGVSGDWHAFPIFAEPPRDWPGALRLHGRIDSATLPAALIIAALCIAALCDAIRRGRSGWTWAEMAAATILLAFGLCHLLDLAILATDPGNPHRHKDIGSRLLWAGAATCLAAIPFLVIGGRRGRARSVTTEGPAIVLSPISASPDPRGSFR